MSYTLPAFLDGFVIPLLDGGDVVIAGPVRPADHRKMRADMGEVGTAELRFLRLRRASELVASPEIPDVDPDELSLWIGLHNLLVFDHPERDRVWARAITWNRMETATRTQLTLSRPESAGQGHVRHIAVDSVLTLGRTDTLLPLAGGELRLRGQTASRRRLRLRGSTTTRQGPRQEVVSWVEQPHTPEVQGLLGDMMRVSPLTCLLRPRLAPADWSPLAAPGYLRRRGYARAVCHAWARDRDWVATGARVTDALLSRLVDGVDVPAAGEVVSALIHVHFLRVLQLEARLGMGLGGREPGVSAFLAIPLLLPRIESVVGTPVGPDAPAGIRRRWAEHLQHLEELTAPAQLENLVATLIPRVVKTA